MNIILIIACIWLIGTAVVLYTQFKDANPNDPSGGLLMLVLGPAIILFALFWPIALPIMAYLDWARKRKNRK